MKRKHGLKPFGDVRSYPLVLRKLAEMQSRGSSMYLSALEPGVFFVRMVRLGGTSTWLQSESRRTTYVKNEHQMDY